MNKDLSRCGSLFTKSFYQSLVFTFHQFSQNVLIQECVAINSVVSEILRSLKELSLGFAGELTMSEQMEALMDALVFDK